MTLEKEKENNNIDELIQSESDHLTLDWMRVLLPGKLQKETSTERPEDGINGMAVKSRRHCNMPDDSDTMTTKNVASDSARSIPYASGDSIQWDQVGILTKGKCIVIAPSENIFGSQESKPYPVPGSKVFPGKDSAHEKGRPDFQKAFALYCTGGLQLNFLYLLWGRNLGTFFNKILPLLSLARRPPLKGR